MKPVLFFFSFLLLGFVLQAQQYHFVYLQTDNKQPFYVRLNEKLFSSSSTGYVIIPKLSEGKHTLTIGFPNNAWPNQNVNINLANKDLGFLLKNFDSKGWGLFNLQTMEVVTNSSPVSKEPAIAETQSDAFSTLLADVVNTPSIKNKEVKKEEEKKETPQEQIEVKKEVEIVKEVPKEEQAVVKSPVKIEKISSAADEKGVIIVYLDKSNNTDDTVAVFIAREEKLPEMVQEPVIVVDQVTVQEKVQTKSPDKVKSTTGTNSPKFIDITLPDPDTIPLKDSVSTNKTEVSGNEVVLNFNSDCKKMATEQDFLKARKKMTAERNEDKMVDAAKKSFKEKCFSTEQVKNLSVLFLKDEAKYKFFDAAYPFVYDTQQFKQLESQLTDQYIIARFRAMIRN